MTEEQITGTRYSGLVSGWIYDGNSRTHDGTDATVAVGLDNGHRLTIPMLVTEAAKVRKGDLITVSVEITREP